MDDPQEAGGATAANEGRISVVLLCLTLLGIALVRARMLGLPLERDEGDYAYGAWRLLEGAAPYTEFYTQRLPGIYATYGAALALFGHASSSIRLALLLTNVATAALVYFTSRRLYSPYAGAVSAAAFGLLSFGANGQGLFANSEHFVVFWAMSSLCVLICFWDGQRAWPLFVAGLLAGIGITIKQHGVFFAAAGGIYVVAEYLRDKPVDARAARIAAAAFAAGVVVPYAMVCAVVWLWWGNFSEFWYWTVSYASEYVSQPPPDPFGNFMRKFAVISRPSPILWAVAGASVFGGMWCVQVARRLPFVLGFAVCTAAAVSVGFYFRLHYFLQAFPLVALLAGAAFQALRALPGRPRAVLVLAAGVLGAGLAQPLVFEWDRIARMSMDEIARSTYGVNPFVESPVIAEYIRARSGPADSVLVMGSEPQIPFYAERRAATGHLYAYALMEPQPYALEMQKQWIADAEAARPAYIVTVSIQFSWLRRPDSHPLIFQWADQYVRSGYVQVGQIDVYADQPPIYAWSDAGFAQPPAPRSKEFIQVYRRLDIAPSG